VRVTTLTKSQKGVFASGSPLSRDQSEPSGHLPPILEVPWIACSCDDRGNRELPNARNLYDPSSNFVAFKYPLCPAVESSNPCEALSSSMSSPKAAFTWE